MRTRNLPVLLVLSLFALALGSSPSHANCTSHTYGQAPFLCAYTFSTATPGGTEATVNGLEYFNQIGGPADAESAGDGGIAGSASVDVDWGLISGACSADNGDFDVFDFNEARDTSRAEGVYADIATLVSDTLPPGTPVSLSVRFDAQEGESGADAGVDMEYDVANFHNQTPTLLHNAFGLHTDHHTLPDPVPLGSYGVGDSLIFAFWVRINCGTTNHVNPPRLAAATQLGYARLAFDIDTPGVGLVSSTSGVDYATVPEAPQALLLVAGGLVVTWRGRRKRIR